MMDSRTFFSLELLYFILSVQLYNNWTFWSNYVLKEFWMVISGVSAVNKISEVTAFEVSQFTCSKITEMLSVSDLTIKIYFRWLFSND